MIRPRGADFIGDEAAIWRELGNAQCSRLQSQQFTNLAVDDIYRWRIGGGGEFLRWEIATGQETLLEKYVPESFIWVSLNERWLIRAVKQNVEIRPTSGGD